MALTETLVIGPDRNGRTVAIVGGLVAASAPAGAPTLAAGEDVIAPGAVCAHTHLYSGLAPYGMPALTPPPTGFLDILERKWWRLDRALDADSLRAAARDYVAKALLAGTTALIDHHESPGFIDGSLTIVADACESLGIRALIAYGASERNGGRAEAKAGLAECARFDETDLVRGLVGLHASFTVSDETIREAGDLARSRGTVVHVHVAEAIDDVDNARRRGYGGPLERLIDLDGLPQGSILAHGVHLTADEVIDARARGLWLVQNPRSNQTNGVGYPLALGHSDKVALGTDGWNADMAEEERALFRLATLHGDGRAEGRLAAGRQLIAERFALAATGFAPGAAGDFVVRDREGRLRHVIVAGRIIVCDGRLLTGDAAQIEAEARAEASLLWARMAAL